MAEISVTNVKRSTLMIIGPHDDMRNLVHKVSMPFLDKFDENYEKVLNTIFQK
jgi:hypothetical protein